MVAFSRFLQACPRCEYDRYRLSKEAEMSEGLQDRWDRLSRDLSLLRRLGSSHPIPAAVPFYEVVLEWGDAPSLPASASKPSSC